MKRLNSSHFNPPRFIVVQIRLACSRTHSVKLKVTFLDYFCCNQNKQEEKISPNCQLDTENSAFSLGIQIMDLEEDLAYLNLLCGCL